MVMVMMMKWVNWWSLRTNAVVAAPVRVMRPVWAAGSGWRSGQGRWQRVRNRRRSHPCRPGLTPVVVVKRSGPRERIRRSGSAGRGRHGRIKSVTSGSGEFSSRALGRPIAQDSVNTGNTWGRPVCADTWVIQYKCCSLLTLASPF